MAIHQTHFLLESLLVLLLISSVKKSASVSASTYDFSSSLNRTNFPSGFIFGTASSAYQYEGGAREGGRGASLWDVYTHKYPGKILDGSNGDMAIDSYHRYKEDVGVMKEMNLDAYRFSISWPRILPNGKLSGGVNKEGIRYYNNVINELISNEKIFFRNDFRDYAEVCFKEFGDRVKHWITLNEPWSYSIGGYASGLLAPARCSEWQGMNCTGGDSATEPYLVAHNQLLAHASAVNLYRNKYQKTQKGKIGITLVSHWMVPYSSAKHHQNAAERALDFMFGW
ncbi:hypothetical protein Pint_31246 [Pistacia integerrima]|uniref:Uncharacterized protein n=1 Tax=Pistacia integerrima TaxID=434235 RepID=A0ACC0XQX0_9ROSI|nr:hypothetical protein Pint_31246 [Pistacia integerrima]